MINSRVLKPGPARRVNPGLGRLWSGTGPGGGKNPLGNWPGETRSTRDPGHPAETRSLIYIDVKGRRFGLLKSENDEE